MMRTLLKFLVCSVVSLFFAALNEHCVTCRVSAPNLANPHTSTLSPLISGISRMVDDAQLYSQWKKALNHLIEKTSLNTCAQATDFEQWDRAVKNEPITPDILDTAKQLREYVKMFMSIPQTGDAGWGVRFDALTVLSLIDLLMKIGARDSHDILHFLNPLHPPLRLEFVPANDLGGRKRPYVINIRYESESLRLFIGTRNVDRAEYEALELIRLQGYNAPLAGFASAQLPAKNTTSVLVTESVGGLDVLEYLRRRNVNIQDFSPANRHYTPDLTALALIEAFGAIARSAADGMMPNDMEDNEPDYLLDLDANRVSVYCIDPDDLKKLFAKLISWEPSDDYARFRDVQINLYLRNFFRWIKYKLMNGFEPAQIQSNLAAFERGFLKADSARKAARREILDFLKTTLKSYVEEKKGTDVYHYNFVGSKRIRPHFPSVDAFVTQRLQLINDLLMRDPRLILETLYRNEAAVYRDFMPATAVFWDAQADRVRGESFAGILESA